MVLNLTNLKNEKTQFKIALKKFLNAHSFYSVDEFFTCTDDMYYWLYDCVNVSYTVIFLLFVGLWHVPHPIVLWLSRIYGMYVCRKCSCSYWNILQLSCDCNKNILQHTLGVERQYNYFGSCHHCTACCTFNNVQKSIFCWLAKIRWVQTLRTGGKKGKSMCNLQFPG